MTTLALPDVFRQAADIIGERGWTRGTDLHPESGNVCANGALRLACGSTVHTAENGMYRMQPPEPGAYAATMTAAHRALDGYLPAHPATEDYATVFRTPRVILFNDKVATSGVEIQQLLREAADWLEAHPLSILAGIEDQPAPYSLTEAGTQALGNKDLVLA